MRRTDEHDPRCVTYRRVSTKKQANEGHSLEEDQPAAIRNLCERFALEPVPEGDFHDTGTGRSNDRPGLKEMMDRVEAEKIRSIVCYSFDRLTRSESAEDAGRLLDWLRLHGVTLYTKQGKIEPGGDHADRLMARIVAAFSTSENERRGMSIGASYQTRFEKGIYHSAEVPYGYSRTRLHEGDTVRTVYERHSTEAGLVLSAFERFANGETLADVAQWLNDQGAQPRRHQYWQGQSVKSMLRSPRYIGLVERGGERNKATNIDPIVPLDLYKAVQARLGREAADRPLGGRSSRAIFGGGLLRCSCGGKLYASWTQRRAGGRTFYYRCQHARHRAGTCKEPNITEDAVLMYIKEHAAELLGRQVWLSLRMQITAHLEDLRREHERVQHNIETYYDMLERDEVTRKRFTERVPALEKTEESLARQIQAAEAEVAPPTFADLHEVLESPDRLASMVKRAVDHIVVSGAKCVGHVMRHPGYIPGQWDHDLGARYAAERDGRLWLPMPNGPLDANFGEEQQ